MHDLSKIRETLMAARELVERGWTQGAFARDAAGMPVNATSPHAVCWCVTGALIRVLGTGHGLFRSRLRKFMFDGGHTNDNWFASQADAVRSFDLAIENVDREILAEDRESAA